MDVILTRRSIRKYTDQVVSDEIVHYLLEAAMSAPSAGNQQPWHFIVIKNRQILEQIPQIHPYSSMVIQAPLAILVCADRNLSKYDADFWIQDCSAATENILLGVNQKGLGAVWLGIYPLEERVQGIKRLLSLPENIIPFSLIPVGYPAEEKGPAKRYNKERIHYDRW